MDKCVQFRETRLGVDQHVGLCQWTLTNRWALNLILMWEQVISEFMRTEGKKLQVPMLLITAGDEAASDGYVMTPQSKQFCENSAVACTFRNYPDAYHALLQEIDEHRDRTIGEIDRFFMENAQLGGVAAAVPEGIRAVGEACHNDLDCMSRYCQARFIFDIFGGQCASKLPAPQRQEPVHVGRTVVVSMVGVAAIFACCA